MAFSALRVRFLLCLLLVAVISVGRLQASTLSQLFPADPCRSFGPLLPAFGRLARFSCPGFKGVSAGLSDALAQSVGRSLPLIAASAGFVYRFDPGSRVFAREIAMPGQLFLETSDPVGKGRWNLGFSYQRVAFEQFEGQDLDRLSDTGAPIAVNFLQAHGPSVRVPVSIPLFGVDLLSDQWTSSATYGATDDLDLNLSVPVLYTRLSVRFRYALPTIPTGTLGPCGTSVCELSGDKLGIGDIFLRGKLRLLRDRWGQVAGGLVVRVPAGNEENFQGTGTWQVAPWLYATSVRFEANALLSLQAYLNTGLDFVVEDVGQSEGRWGVGLDIGVADRATIGIAVLARYPFAPPGSPGTFDVPRCEGPPGSCTPIGSAPMFGLRNSRPDYYDLSTGLRVDLWADTLIAFANALVPLNDDGLRAGVIPLVGIEATF